MPTLTAPEAAAPKHTPGPWVYIDATKEASLQYRPLCVIRSGDKQIASFSWHSGNSPWFPTKDQSQANAALIASAPDLLSIARRWAAIDGGAWHPDRYESERAELMRDTRAAIAKAESGA